MRLTFRLKDDRDGDLISWFKVIGEGERSFFIRQVLRRGLCGEAQEVKIPKTSSELITKPVQEEPITVEEAENRLLSLINNL